MYSDFYFLFLSCDYILAQVKYTHGVKVKCMFIHRILTCVRLKSSGNLCT